MSSPRIGVTCSFQQWPESDGTRNSLQRYLDTLQDAGMAGELLWLPALHEAEPNLLEQQAARLALELDGLVLGGGRDLPPSSFGEAELPQAEVRPVPPERPRFELALLQGMLHQGKPVLGICYGCQLLNVWGGGTLIQDIAFQLPAAMDHRDGHHSVAPVSGSRLHEILGDSADEVRSSHHQAIARPAPEATVSCHAVDGVIEAIEFRQQPFLLGVQWHPECDRESHTTRRLFGALKSACRA